MNNNYIIHKLLENKQENENIFLSYKDSNISYKIFNEKSNQLARYLLRIGLRKNLFVGIYLDCSIESAIVTFSILKVGGICVPIDTGAFPDS